MKNPVPVTIDDLRASAKDDKAGLSFYGHLKVYLDDANDSYSYWYKGKSITEAEIKNILLGKNYA